MMCILKPRILALALQSLAWLHVSRPLHDLPSTQLARRDSRTRQLLLSTVPSGTCPSPSGLSLVSSRPQPPGASAAGDPSVLLFRWRANLHRRWPSRRSKKKGDRAHRQTSRQRGAHGHHSRETQQVRVRLLDVHHARYLRWVALNAPTSPLFLFAGRAARRRGAEESCRLAQGVDWHGGNPNILIARARDGNLDAILVQSIWQDPP
jgi:hypothetical protein